MNPLLDTVEPDAWRYQTVRNIYRYRGACPNFNVDYKVLKPVGLLTIPHVELLLTECRKEALLEAVEVCKTIANDAEDCGATPEMLEIVYAIEAELRRMAEGEK